MKRTITAAIATAAILSAGAAAHAAIDTSSITQPSRLMPVDAHRILDTRDGPAVEGEIVVDAAALLGFTGGDAAKLGITAAAVNITVLDAAGPVYVTAWSDGPRPEASILNVDTGDIDSNYVVVPVVDGTFRLYTSGPAHLLVDLMGAYTTS